jgi:uncharacterized protein (TIRG00374 family)
MAGPGEEHPDARGQVSGPGRADAEAADDEDYEDEEEPRFFTDPKRLLQTAVVVLLIVVAIYLLLPSIVGLDDAIRRVQTASWIWVVVALTFNVLAFVSYVALFRGVVGEQVQLTWSEGYQITMAGLAATRLFSAGGAGGIVLTYWALRKAGMPRRTTATRMVAFLVLLYAVYLVTIVVDGILLRTGVFNGPNPAGLTIVPAAIAGAGIVLVLLVALVPGDLEKRMRAYTNDNRVGRAIRGLATVPASVASGVRTAIAFVREPSRGGLALAGAIGFWAANIGILWASFHAFDVQVPLGVVVQGFFLGMVANLIPFVPGGVGAVDAGLIGAFVLFGYPGSEVFAAVLLYRLIAFWLPIPPGIVAFLQLRRTVARWEQERRREPVGSDVAESLPGSVSPGAGSITSESKVL